MGIDPLPIYNFILNNWCVIIFSRADDDKDQSLSKIILTASGGVNIVMEKQQLARSFGTDRRTEIHHVTFI